MSRILKSRRALVLGVVAALGIAAAAFAYWTTSGGGSGSGSVGTAAAASVHGTITTALVPGGSSSVTLTADKDAHTTYKIGAITGTVSVDKTHADAGCKASDFAFVGPTADETVAAGTGTQALTNGSVSMDNTSDNQDACKGADLTLTLTVAAPAAA